MSAGTFVSGRSRISSIGAVLAVSMLPLMLGAGAEDKPESRPQAVATGETVGVEPGHHEIRVAPPAVPVDKTAQPRSPRAVVSRGMIQSIQVNVDSGQNNIIGDAANEPTLAIDPTDPNNIVIGWRQFDTIASDFRQAGVAYSHDGGATWTFPGPLDPGQFRSDPVLATDTLGNFYYYSLSSATSAQSALESPWVEIRRSWTCRRSSRYRPRSRGTPPRACPRPP